MRLEGYELPARALAAALTHAAYKDTRPYLNGVYFDFRAGRIAASDGHRMFVGAIPAADCDSLIVDRAQVEAVLKASKTELRKGYSLVVQVDDAEAPGGPPRVTILNVFTGVSFADRAIDGTYPDVAKAVPSDTLDVATGHYNARYMLDAQKALAIYSGSNEKRAAFPVRQHGPIHSCLITDRSAFCIVMSMRTGEVDPIGDLAWFNAKPKFVKP